MSSLARGALTRLMSARAVNGVLVVPKGDGCVEEAELAPGSMAYPQCRCPRHRDKPTVDPTLRIEKGKP